MNIKKGECSYSLSNAIRTLAMVRATGLEPACLTTYEPKSYVSANSTTPAYSFVPLIFTRGGTRGGAIRLIYDL